LTLKLRHCCFSVGSQRLLEDVSATIPSGCVTGILGANGAGKTSLVHLAAGYEKAQSGSIRLDAIDLKSWSRGELAKKIAVLPQTATLDFPFSVEEVVLMGRIPHQSDEATNRALVAKVLSLFSLTDFAQRPYTSLSGGEKQRVQICRVVSQVIDDLSHAHLLFDEPIAPLDIAHQVAFFRLVRGFAAQGTAVGLVLHDIELACQFCDEIILMSAGKILGAGKPAAVITSDSIQQAFDVSATVTKGPAGAIQLIFAD